MDNSVLNNFLLFNYKYIKIGINQKKISLRENMRYKVIEWWELWKSSTELRANQKRIWEYQQGKKSKKMALGIS